MHLYFRIKYVEFNAVKLTLSELHCLICEHLNCKLGIVHSSSLFSLELDKAGGTVGVMHAKCAWVFVEAVLTAVAVVVVMCAAAVSVSAVVVNCWCCSHHCSCCVCCAHCQSCCSNWHGVPGEV